MLAGTGPSFGQNREIWLVFFGRPCHQVGDQALDDKRLSFNKRQVASAILCTIAPALAVKIAGFDEFEMSISVTWTQSNLMKPGMDKDTYHIVLRNYSF